MAKVHVKTKIESAQEKHDFDGLAMMRENRIVYYDNKIKTSIQLGNVIEITRRCDDTLISLCFSPIVQATCKLKKPSLTLPMKLELSYIKQEERIIDIHYKLEDETFVFHLEYEVVE